MKIVKSNTPRFVLSRVRDGRREFARSDGYPTSEQSGAMTFGDCWACLAGADAFCRFGWVASQVWPNGAVNTI